MPDQIRQTLGGPQLGGEAVVGRRLAEPTPHLGLLAAVEFGFGACMLDGSQPPGAVTTECGQPAKNGANMDAKEIRNLLRGIAFVNPLDSKSAAAFQFSDGKVRSHVQ